MRRALLFVCLLAGCGSRVGYLEVALPFDRSAEGLFAQVRLVGSDGRVGTVSPPRLVDATRAEHEYSVEIGSEPARFTLEVCLCDGASDCFDAAGGCRGVGAARGGLYTFEHERTGFVGERTRWTASTCPMETTACPLADLTGDDITVPVWRCAVEGCCPLCMPGRYCSDPTTEVHRCE